MDFNAGPKMFGDPDVIETSEGVVYRFRGLPRPSFFLASSFLVLLVVGLLTAAAAGATLLFLVGFGDQLPWYLVALPCLFILQSGLIAGFLLWATGRYLFRHLLFDAFAGHELELHDGWLSWGKRLGRFRQGYRHALTDLRGLVVITYTAGNGDREAHFGVETLAGERPTFYCCCCDEQEVLALALDLHPHVQRQANVPLRMVETTEDDARRWADLESLTAPSPIRPPWQRWYVWYPWHVSGAVGLAALFAALRSLDLPWPAWVYALIWLGFLMEIVMLSARPNARE